MKPILLTVAAASAAVGLSSRRLQQMAKAGEIASFREIDPETKRRVIMFDAVLISRLAESRKMRAEAMPAPVSADAAALDPRNETGVSANTEKSAKVALAPRFALAASPAAWLTLEAAAAHTGLSVRLLARLVAEGGLPALDEGKSHGAWGRWRVKRADLDALAGVRQNGENSVRVSE